MRRSGSKSEDPLHDIFNTSFFGVRAIQHWSDVALWECFFNEHPQIKTVVELGSGGHGLSIIFALNGVTRGFKLITFDRRRYESLDWPLPKLLQLEDTFASVDLFADKVVKRMVEWLGRDELHPLLLFCDNGDKPREFATFVPHLRAGDYVGVHDWKVEFHPKDAQIDVNLEPWQHELADRMGGSTRLWEVRS